MSIASGTKLGRYEIRSKIGEGGMGEVYLAQDIKLDRKVAIKFLPERLLANEHAGKRLVREAQAAAKLDHANICSIYEVDEEDGRSFIVMQYVEGETLDVRLKQKPLDVAQSLTIAAQVADGLAEAHARGIIHRDIKPSNIIITPRGQAKVMDFGLAKLSREIMGLDTEAETQNFLTTPGAIIGTVPYMSPEQLHGQPIDARSDIFSFGVVLYEMLTGQQPFAAESGAATIAAILTKEPEPLRHYSACPEELQRIVSKCLHKDRERRYQTMREVATDLENAQQECRSGTLVARRLHPSVSLFGSPRGSLTVSKRLNSAAYDYYLRGKLHLSSLNRENNESAIKLLEQAVDADPSFAPAYAQLARAYCMKASLFAPEAEKKRLNEEAKVAVEKALALNPDLAEGHCNRGYVLWTHANRFPHEQVIQCYKRAIALDPNLEQAHDELGAVYWHIGLLDKAEEEIRKALAINPSDTLARGGFGLFNICRAKYEEALDVFKTVPPEVNPAMRANATAITLLQLGRTQEASELIEEYLNTYAVDEGGIATSFKAMLLAKAGREPEAEETIQRAIEMGKGFQHFHHTTYNIASAYALLKKPDQALKWLQFTADDGFPCYPLFENDANLNSLRKDERFIAFMAKVKEQWERYNTVLNAAEVRVDLQRLQRDTASQPATTPHSEARTEVESPPTGDKAVYAFLELFALAFTFEGASAMLRGESLWRVVGAWIVAVIFFVAGIQWPRIKLLLREQFGSQGHRTLANRDRQTVAFTPRKLIVSAAVMVLAFLAALYFYYPRATFPLHSSNSGGIESIDAIAVLPLENMTHEQNAEYLSDGITDSLINSLSKLPHIRVIARNSAFQFKNQAADLQQVAKRLNVQAVLTGRVLMQGDTLSINVEMTDTQNQQLWGQHYTRKAADIFTVQDEIARQVTDSLRLRLTNAQQEQVSKRYTENTEAYRLYLQGRYYLNQGSDESANRAVSLFSQGIALDPGYALAYEARAEAFIEMGDVSLPMNQAKVKVKQDLEKALSLDDKLVEARTTLAIVKFQFDWDFADAEEDFRQVIALNSNYAEAHHQLAYYLALTGRPLEAVPETKLAQQLDPVNPSISIDVCLPYGLARQYDEATAAARNTVEMFPNFWLAHMALGAFLFEKGDFSAGIQELEKAKAMDGNPVAIGNLGYAYGRAGRKDEARKLLADLINLSKQTYVPAYYIAVIHAGLGERDEAFAALEKAYQDRSWWLVWIKMDQKVDSLRADPRFVDLMRRIGFPQ